MQGHPTIGVLSPLLAGNYFGLLLDSIHKAARQHGAHVVAIQTLCDRYGAPWPPLRHHLGWNHVDGWIVLIDAADDQYLAELSASGKPLVTISMPIPGIDCPVVQADNQGGAAAALRHLIEHGHRRIAFLGNLGQEDLRQRYQAYLSTLAEHGIEPDSSLFYHTHDNLEEGGRQAAHKMLAEGINWTAIFCTTDQNALGCMEVLQQGGKRIPEDLAIASFDDMLGVQYTKPPLSSVRQRYDLLASKALELVLKRLRGEAVPGGLVQVETHFIPRRSCGCPPPHSTTVNFEGLRDRPEERRQVLEQQLLAALLTPLQPNPAERPTQRWPGLQQLVDGLMLAVSGVDGDKTGDLRHVWEQALELNTDVDASNRVLRIIEHAGYAELALRKHTHGDSLLKDFLADMRMELMRTWQLAERQRSEHLDTVIVNNYQARLALARLETSDHVDLEWLARLHMRWGCWAAWDEPEGDEPAKLVVSALYNPHQLPAPELGTRYKPEELLPTELWPSQLGVEAEPLMLLPILSASRDWGVLALAGPIETRVSDGLSTSGQWATLFGTALAHQQLLKSLRESEERYALAAGGANDGLWDWNLRSNEVYFSPRWRSMLGYQDHEVGNSLEDWLTRVHPDDIARLTVAVAAHLREESSHFEHEYRIQHNDGSYRWMLCRGLAVRDTSGNPTRMAGSQTDINERKRVEEQMDHGNLHDYLTGLPNRTLFMDRLGRALEHIHRRDDELFAVLFLDLDNFKQINESLGHASGDQLLLSFVKRLEACLRSSDTIARLGGDEFALLLENLRSISDATYIADRIQEDLKAPFVINDHEVVTSASIGITLGTPSYSKAEELLRDADIAMYRAKARGRACYEIFDSAMHTRVMRFLTLEAELRRAIEREELLLHYQPLVSLHSRQIVGVEALARWQHAEKGMISPGDFIPIAEETGLILPLGEWVLRTACAQAREWEALGIAPLTIAVNISARQFRQSIRELIVRTLESTGLAPENLELELTESSVMDQPEVAGKTLQELKQIGVRLALDDFGTGYSSLAYLKQLPIDVLKIDRSFVKDSTSDPSDAAIVVAIIAMAHSLKLQVIAEGVENEKQLGFLTLRRCDMAQGYLISRPIPAEQITPLLQSGWSLDTLIRT